MPSVRTYFQTSVSGQKELARVLDELPKSLTDSVLRQTAKLALQLVADAAKTLVARQSLLHGDLLNSIEISTVLKSSQKEFENGRPGDVNVYVGASSPKGNVAHLVEFGTGPRYHANGKYVGVMPAEPFMRPAWDGNKGSVLDIFRVEIWTVLKKAARSLRGRAERGTLSGSQSRFFGGW